MGCLFGKLTSEIPSIPAVAGDSVAEATAAPQPVPPPTLPRHPSGKNPVFSNKDDPKWPDWLSAVAGDALAGLSPRRADSFQMIEKIGSGTYSNVYKAKDRDSGQFVALKKVRVDVLDDEDSIKFMVREIELLRRLDHPNVIRLEGLAVSRIQLVPSLYLIFEYMEHDLAGLAATAKFTEAQVKCFLRQLLCGLEHCHSRGVLHRDIKCANLLLSKEGILKLADFGLATSFDLHNKRRMTPRVVTLWYRAPELLLGATDYGVGVDLWSVGCIMPELLTGKPILPGAREVEQVHKIFKLCGSPPEDYLSILKLPRTTDLNAYNKYSSRVDEFFADLPPSSISLIKKLLSLVPTERGTATDALNSEFFSTEPYACETSSLPQYPPSKEKDIKLARNKVGRQRSPKDREREATARARLRNSSCRAAQALEAGAKLKADIDRKRLMASASMKSRFPPPHLDAAIGFLEDASVDKIQSSTSCKSGSSKVASQKQNHKISSSVAYFGRHATRGNNRGKERHNHLAHKSVLIGAWPHIIGNSGESKNQIRNNWRVKPKISAF